MRLKDDYRYEVRVSLTPSQHDNFDKPYFWAVVKTSNKTGESYNTGCFGWAKNPDNAWELANTVWKKFNRVKQTSAEREMKAWGKDT